MLRRIEPCDVKIGMFIHKVEGRWWDNPFWRSQFLLRNPQQLRKLHEARLEAVVIDTTRGADLAAAPAEGAPDAAPAPARRRRRAAADLADTPADPAAPHTTAREFGRASTAAQRGFKVAARVFLEMRMGKKFNTTRLEPVIDDICDSIQRNPHAFNGLMRCRQHCEYAYHHAIAVSALMVSLGRQLGLAEDILRQAGMAGMLLDTGIAQMPVDLAQYGGDYRKLAPEILREHVWIGHDFLKTAGIAAPVVRACLEHHERIDGTGYPRRIAADEISLLGRMAAICDAYDHLASDVDGSAGLGPARALDRLQAMNGAFDETLLAAFISAVGTYPIGSVVVLGSKRLGLVVDLVAQEEVLPVVMTFWCAQAGQLLPPEKLTLTDGADTILRAVDPATFGIEGFAALRERLFAQACAHPAPAG